MKKLIINKKVLFHSFSQAEREWQNNKNIKLVTEIIDKDIESVIPILIKELPKDLPNCILSDLLERESFPSQYLKEIYDKGDKGCKITICLRKDLSPDLYKICKNSNDEDIKALFTNKKI